MWSGIKIILIEQGWMEIGMNRNEILKMELAGLSVGEFLERLGSGDPTPGGGAAASLSAAMGAALLMMVANHTIGKERYAEYEQLNIEVRDNAAELRTRFIEGIDRDAEAFLNVSAAFGMPKSLADIEMDRVSAKIAELSKTDEALAAADMSEGLTEENMELIENALKAARSAAIGEASIAAAEAPLAVMEDCVLALRLAQRQLDHSNPNLKSDILVAALNLQSGLTSAGFNVDANIPAIKRRDQETASRLSNRADELRMEASKLVTEITGK
jgi:formiminotetrahydrofolate cyclodeaminase